jgi:hypothetical protein
MKLLLVSLSLFLCLGMSSFKAQEINKPEQLKKIQEQRKLDRLRPGAKTRDGFTVLLRFTDDKDDAENTRKRFVNQFEESFLCEVIWHEPKFKVFAGAFLTRAEAVNLLHKVRNSFPNAMIVETKI